MSQQTRKLSESDLRDAIDHLKYELEMLKDVAEILSSGHKYGRIVGNSLVESFVIHARGLVMFLYNQPREDDDVMAVDYFDEGEWERIRPEMPAILSDTLKRANKEVAHLTTFRVGKELVDKRWEHPKIGRSIFEIFRSFFDEVSAARMPAGYKSWFDSHYMAMNQSDNSIDRSVDNSDRST